MNKTRIIGVSGVIGSGKSTVCRYLSKEKGWFWIEADQIVREHLYKVGQPGYEKIKSYFGPQCVGKNGVLRGRLRRIVLKNQQKLWILNQLIHPLIFHEIGMIVQKLKMRDIPGICIEAIYFEESDLGRFIDSLFVVDVPDDVVLDRMKNSAMGLEDAKAFLKLQKKSLPKWGVKISNRAAKEDLYDTVDRLIQ